MNAMLLGEFVGESVVSGSRGDIREIGSKKSCLCKGSLSVNYFYPLKT